jgi:hypothetical protein
MSTDPSEAETPIPPGGRRLAGAQIDDDNYQGIEAGTPVFVQFSKQAMCAHTP